MLRKIGSGAAAIFVFTGCLLASDVAVTNSRLTGEYLVYGGSLGDRITPSAKDKKVALSITGPLAREMFRHFGKSSRTASCEEGTETRAKGSIVCIAEGKSGSVTCYLGLDLSSGAIIDGVIC